MFKVKPYEQIIAERAAAPKAKPSIESLTIGGVTLRRSPSGFFTASRGETLRDYVDAVHKATAHLHALKSEFTITPTVDGRRLELKYEAKLPGRCIEQQVDELRVAADANGWDDPSAQAYAKGLQSWLSSPGETE